MTVSEVAHKLRSDFTVGFHNVELELQRDANSLAWIQALEDALHEEATVSAALPVKAKPSGAVAWVLLAGSDLVLVDFTMVHPEPENGKRGEPRPSATVTLHAIEAIAAVALVLAYLPGGLAPDREPTLHSASIEVTLVEGGDPLRVETRPDHAAATLAFYRVLRTVRRR